VVHGLRRMLRCDSIGNQARRDCGSDVAVAFALVILGWRDSPEIPVKEGTGWMNRVWDDLFLDRVRPRVLTRGTVRGLFFVDIAQIRVGSILDRRPRTDSMMMCDVT
jgi:hypothetical protein